MDKKVANSLKYTLAGVLTVYLVYYALKDINWSVFVREFNQTNWWFVAMSLLFAFIALVFRSERWRSLMLPINKDIRRLDLWDACNIGNLVSIAVPWVSFLVRVGAVTDRKTPYDKTVGTIIMERAWDMLTVLLLLIAALLLKSGEISEWLISEIGVSITSKVSMIWYIVAILAAIILSIVLSYRLRTRHKIAGKIAGWCDGIFAGFKSFAGVERKSVFILYTLGIWGSYVMMCWCVFKAIPLLGGLDFTDALFISVVGNLSALIPAPGGFGAYHNAVALALSSFYGASWEIGILFATLTHETRSLMLVALGVISTAASQRRKNAQPRS